MLFKLPHTLPLKHGALKLVKSLRQVCVEQGLCRLGILALTVLKFFTTVRNKLHFSLQVKKALCASMLFNSSSSFLLSVTAICSRGTQSLLQLCLSIVLHTAGTRRGQPLTAVQELGQRLTRKKSFELSHPTHQLNRSKTRIYF